MNDQAELKEYVLSNRVVWDKLAIEYAKSPRDDWPGVGRLKKCGLLGKNDATCKN